MKYGLALFMMIFLLPLGAWAERIELGSSASDVNVTVLESNSAQTILRFEVNAFSRDFVKIGGQDYAVIHCGKEANRLEAGSPDLPRVSRSIVISDNFDMSVRVLESDYRDFTNTPVAPSKGNLLRTVDPAHVPYTFGSAYQTADWFPTQIAEAREPYILRDLRGMVVEVNPFQYLPSEKTLRVYVSMTVVVETNGPSTTNVLNRATPFTRVDPGFDLVYRRHFLNYGLGNAMTYVPVVEDGEMLIITYDTFRSAVLPFAAWKIQKGIATTVVNLSSIGNTTTAIQNCIQNFYNDPSHHLAYVLLVGDAEQLATPTASGGSSDPSYAKLAGSDNYPDVFIGRFSATSVAEVQTQVNRTIAYERDAAAGTSWYPHGTCIGSAEGPGHNGGEYDYQHEGNLRTDLLGFTYTTVDPIYDPGATASQVSTALNAGRSIVNYTGHGSETSWGTTGFSNTNVNALTNDDKLPFIFSVACVNGSFAGMTCFAEAWLRATHNGHPIGALATYMSSINQSWNPPMDAQDEATDLLCAQAHTTFGGLCFNASCKMMDLNPGTDGADMYNTWHIFGDPSVQIRTAAPVAMSVTNDAQITFNQPTFDVTVAGVSGALCALSLDTILFGSGYTDASGQASVAITREMPIGVYLKLTVTAFNKVTYTADVPVITSGPDVWPPTISITTLPTTTDSVGPYVLRATITDYSGVASATCYFSFDSTTFSPLAMTRDTGSTWIASLAGQSPGTTTYYYISATDSAETPNTGNSAVYDFSIFGLLLSDDMETGAPGWTTSSLQTGWVNQWHLSTNRSHSGSQAWKFGGSGVGADTLYANHAYGGLVSPSIHLFGQATLTYWQFVRGEVSGAYPDSAYDVGVVDLSVDSGAWTQLSSLAPNYNKLVRCTAGGSRLYSGPFSCRTPGFSGSIDWSLVSLNLDAYAGHDVRVRFRFGSDSTGGKEGWYVDDFSILGLPQPPVAPSAVANVVTDVTDDGVRIAWPPSGAPWYKVYSSPEVYGPFNQLEATVSDTIVIITPTSDLRFFIVKASTAP